MQSNNKAKLALTGRQASYIQRLFVFSPINAIASATKFASLKTCPHLISWKNKAHQLISSMIDLKFHDASQTPQTASMISLGLVRYFSGQGFRNQNQTDILVFPKFFRDFGMVWDSSTFHLSCQPTRPLYPKFFDLPNPISIPLIPGLVFAAYGSQRALRSASNRIRYRSSSMYELFHVLSNEIATNGYSTLQRWI